jgi:hypothetical protein
MPRKLFFLEAAAAASLAFLASCSGRTGANIPIRTYQMGERIELPPLVYAVFEKQWLAQLGDGPDVRYPQNRFLLIRISATNSGSAETFVPNLTVEDDAGNSCGESSNGEGVPRWIVFDCAPKHYRLKLVNDEGNAAYVEIPLSFDSESPGIDILPKKDDKTVDLAHPK